MEPLSYEKMEFEEFCAAATHQLEVLARWNDIAIRTFEYFEQEGNEVTSVEELARVNTHFHFPLSFKCHRQFMQEMNLGPTDFSLRSSDGKLIFLGIPSFYVVQINCEL